jgi:transposase
MAYSVDLRSRVIEYMKEGHTKEETSLIFRVGTSTIQRWLALLSETGSLEKRPLDRSPSIFESEKLNAYIEKNPNALLKDVAEHFGGSVTGAFYALKREKITYKKKRFIIKKEMRKNVSGSRKSWL